MEKDRIKWLQQKMGELILDVRFGNRLKPSAFIIDNQQGKSNDVQELLEKENFVVFSSRNLSNAAVENMESWPQHLRIAYQTSKLPSSLMIMDPTQEEKSQFLAKMIIGFYNQRAGNYNLFNRPNDAGNMIPAFEGVGELDKVLAKVGFMVQKSDDGNTVIVSGKGFTLNVDGPSGEIVDIQQVKTRMDDRLPENDKKIITGENVFEELYRKGKKGIADFKQFWENLRGKSR